MFPGRRERRAWALAAVIAFTVTGCGAGSHTTTHRGHLGSAGHPSAGSGDATTIGEADGTATIALGVSATTLPSGWTACPSVGADDAGAVTPRAHGCAFLRATELQVQELLHNEGSTVFNTPESIGVSPPGQPQLLMNCTAQHNGPTIVCAANGVPMAIVFRPPGE